MEILPSWVILRANWPHNAENAGAARCYTTRRRKTSNIVFRQWYLRMGEFSVTSARFTFNRKVSWSMHTLNRLPSSYERRSGSAHSTGSQSLLSVLWDGAASVSDVDQYPICFGCPSSCFWRQPGLVYCILGIEDLTASGPRKSRSRTKYKDLLHSLWSVPITVDKVVKRLWLHLMKHFDPQVWFISKDQNESTKSAAEVK